MINSNQSARHDIPIKQAQAGCVWTIDFSMDKLHLPILQHVETQTNLNYFVLKIDYASMFQKCSGNRLIAVSYDRNVRKKMTDRLADQQGDP